MRSAVAFLLALTVGLPSPVLAARLPEDEVKAAVVVNLLSFVQWPKEALAAEKELRVCVRATESVAMAFAKVPAGKVHGLPIAVRRLAAGDELTPCHVILVGPSNADQMRAAQAAQDRPILLIGDGAGALERGAMVGIDTDHGRVVFDINLGALRKSHLTVSSKLLPLVRRLIE